MIYVYEFVKTGNQIEVEQSIREEPFVKMINPKTGKWEDVKRIICPAGLVFRGNGWTKNE